MNNAENFCLFYNLKNAILILINKHLMKKLLIVLPLAALLAAGCSSSSVNGTMNNQGSANQQMTPAPSPTPSSSQMDQGSANGSISNGSGWQATLQASDNIAKGQ